MPVNLGGSPRQPQGWTGAATGRNRSGSRMLENALLLLQILVMAWVIFRTLQAETKGRNGGGMPDDEG